MMFVETANIRPSTIAMKTKPHVWLYGAAMLTWSIGACAGDSPVVLEAGQVPIAQPLEIEQGLSEETPPTPKLARSEMAGSLALSDPSARLLNIDFGSWWELAVGFAAVGHTTNDVWNRYAAPWALLGEISEAVWSAGTPSPVRIIVENAPGQWSNETKDPMYRTYSYPHNGAPIIVTISNLPPAFYDLYLYGHGGPNREQRPPTREDARQNGVFRVMTPDNGAFYGEAATAATEAWLDPVWTEGSQFVVFRKIAATEGNDRDCGPAGRIVARGHQRRSVGPDNQIV
jgi:hypothetical protein